jgi:hypothetical protein
MGKRIITLERPGTGGEITDREPDALGAQEVERLENGLAPYDITVQRRGWAYQGATNGAVNLRGVARVKFVLTKATREVVTYAGNVKLNGGNALASAVAPTGTAIFLPRAVYRDELILCAQDGQTPLLRYSGAASEDDNATADWVAGTATYVATVGTWTGEAGWFLRQEDSGVPRMYHRVLERTSTTSMTLEDVLASTPPGASTATVQATGRTFPCVSVYEAGTVGTSGTTMTGVGTKWTTGAWGEVEVGDAVLTKPAGDEARVSSVDVVTDDDTLTVTTTIVSEAPYAILRACPFKDVAAHKGSFWGAGVDQHPTNVYVSPPGWNPSLPPGATLPVDPTIPFTANEDEYDRFLLDVIPVPSAHDGDPIVALMTSFNPLLAAKRRGLHGIFGSWPNFEVAEIADGAGCIDIKSAWELSPGPVWAGEDGVFLYVGGNDPVRDLTDDRINREWRSLTADFDYGVSDYCTISEDSGFLTVHITTGGGTTQRTYRYDIRARTWGRVTNMNARFQFPSRVPGEQSKLLWVSDDEQGRVMDMAPALNLSGTARDADGHEPNLKLWTGSGLSRAARINVDTRVTEIRVDANIHDSAGAGSTLGVSVVDNQRIDGTGAVTTTLEDIPSKNFDGTQSFRRDVGRRAEQHQIRLEKEATQTTEVVTEIARITVALRDSDRPM